LHAGVHAMHAGVHALHAGMIAYYCHAERSEAGGVRDNLLVEKTHLRARGWEEEQLFKAIVHRLM